MLNEKKTFNCFNFDSEEDSLLDDNYYDPEELKRFHEENKHIIHSISAFTCMIDLPDIPPPQNDRQKKKQVCKFYLRGSCLKGSACMFIHSDRDLTPEEIDDYVDASSELQPPKRIRSLISDAVFAEPGQAIKKYFLESTRPVDIETSERNYAKTSAEDFADIDRFQIKPNSNLLDQGLGTKKESTFEEVEEILQKSLKGASTVKKTGSNKGTSGPRLSNENVELLKGSANFTTSSLRTQSSNGPTVSTYVDQDPVMSRLRLDEAEKELSPLFEMSQENCEEKPSSLAKPLDNSESFEEDFLKGGSKDSTQNETNAKGKYSPELSTPKRRSFVEDRDLYSDTRRKSPAVVQKGFRERRSFLGNYNNNHRYANYKPFRAGRYFEEEFDGKDKYTDSYEDDFVSEIDEMDSRKGFQNKPFSKRREESYQPFSKRYVEPYNKFSNSYAGEYETRKAGERVIKLSRTPSNKPGSKFAAQEERPDRKYRDERFEPFEVSDKFVKAERYEKKDRVESIDRRPKTDKEYKTNDLINTYEKERNVRLLLDNFDTIVQDQGGCKYMQALVTTLDRVSFRKVFEKLMVSFREIAINSFGNYLCQKMIEVMSPTELEIVLDLVEADPFYYALNGQGTRVIQKLIEKLVCNDRSIDFLHTFLKGNVGFLTKDVNGNHIVQKVLMRMGEGFVGVDFVYKELLDDFIELACQKHGCCVLQRSIDYSKKEFKLKMAAKTHEHVLELMQNEFGNYVVQYLADKIGSSLVRRALKACRNHLIRLSKQKYSSNVIEKLINLAEESERMAVIEELLNCGELEELLEDKYGNYVVQKAIAISDYEQRKMFIFQIRALYESSKSDGLAKKICHKILKKYSRD